MRRHLEPHGQVALPLVQGPQDLRVVERADVETDARELAPELGDGLRRDAEPQGRQDRQADVALADALQVKRGLAQRADPAVQLVDLAEQGMRLVSGRQAALQATEEGEAEPALSVPQDLADRRLRDVERPRRAA